MDCTGENIIIFLSIKKMFLIQTGLIFPRDPEFTPEERPLEKINLEHLIFPYIILGVGTTAAILVFTFEIILAKCKKYGSGSISSNGVMVMFSVQARGYHSLKTK